MAKIIFGGVEENVVTRDEFSLEKSRQVLMDEVVAVIGYGVQGPGQSLNLKDNGIKVIVGQRKNSKSWSKAVDDPLIHARIPTRVTRDTTWTCLFMRTGLSPSVVCRSRQLPLHIQVRTVGYDTTSPLRDSV